MPADSCRRCFQRAKPERDPFRLPSGEPEGEPAKPASHLHSREFHLEPAVRSCFMCRVIAELLHSYQAT